MWWTVVIGRVLLLVFVGSCSGSSMLVVSLWWLCAVVGVGGVLWWVLNVGCVPVLVCGVGRLSWPFVVAGGHGGWSSHVIVCWWVRVGKLDWRCSPMNNDELLSFVVWSPCQPWQYGTWGGCQRIQRMGVETYFGWRCHVLSLSGDSGLLSSLGGHCDGG